ncbi:MAG: hypothetical protein LBC73_07195 [Oscillospiraceae bacterium]|jgi:hypothetical protein|nr:hypothetical protein [Oscillospiraceae bacterium]
MHLFQLFISYLIVFPIISLIIYAILKFALERQDREYQSNIELENYIMRYKKSTIALNVALMFMLAAFISFPIFMNAPKVEHFIYSVLVVSPLIILLLIQIIVMAKWKVAVDGETIKMDTLYRGKRTFNFNDIIYATEESNLAYSRFGCHDVTYHVFARGSQDKIIKLFIVTKTTHGYDAFASKLKEIGKIDKQESECRNILSKHRYISWTFLAFAILLTIAAIVFTISAISDLNYKGDPEDYISVSGFLASIEVSNINGRMFLSLLGSTSVYFLPGNQNMSEHDKILRSSILYGSYIELLTRPRQSSDGTFYCIELIVDGVPIRTHDEYTTMIRSRGKGTLDNLVLLTLIYAAPLFIIGFLIRVVGNRKAKKVGLASDLQHIMDESHPSDN